MQSESNRKIRVCFIAPKGYRFFCAGVEGVIGGSEIDLYYLATELARDDGFQVSFVVADYGQPSQEEHEGVRVIKSLDFQQGALGGARRIWRALGEADAEIYVIKTFSAGVPLTEWFCRRQGRVFIYRTAHRYDCDGTYRRRRPILGMAFARALRRAQVVLAQNETDARLLAETLGVRAQVIPNGHRLGPVGDRTRDIILWVGRTTEFKQPELFVELARRNRREKFYMICQQATEDKNYAALVEQARQVDNLEFIPFVPFQEIDQYFQRARLLVNTSRAEGFPNTFIQACTCATPILSLKVNPDGFLDRFGCGICVAGDRKMLDEKLHYMLKPEVRVKFGEKGRRYVEDHHDIGKIIEQYKKIFRQLTSD